MSATGFAQGNDGLHRHEVYLALDGDVILSSVPFATAEGNGNARYLIGPDAMIYLPTEGTHTLTVLVREVGADMVLTGLGATGSTTISVGSENAAYPGQDTICLSPSGNFEGAPAGARLITGNDISAAIRDWSNGTTAPKRIMPRGGETFVQAAQAVTGGDLLIKAFGTGRALIPNAGGFNLSPAATVAAYSHDFRLSGLDADGPYDSLAASGPDTSFIGALFPNTPRNLIHVDNCDIRGFNFHTNFADDGAHLDVGFAATDSVFKDFGHSIFYQFQTRDFGLVGVDYGALDGARTDQGNNGGFPLRIDTSRVQSVSHSQGTSGHGWSGWINGEVAIQSIGRFGTGTTRTDRISVTKSVLRGGSTMLSAGTVEEGASSIPRAKARMRVEGNTFIGDHQTSTIANVSVSPFLMRNNKAFLPTMAGRNGFDPALLQLGISNGDGAAEPSLFTGLIALIHNTVVNDLDGPLTELVNPQTSYTDVVVGNNALVEANLGTPNISDGPLDETPIYDPSTTGYVDGTGTPVAGTGIPSDASGTLVPQVGAGVIEDALGPITFRDGANVQRADPASRGALEPA
ncbi:hypothetical protein [Palleronia pelagia]|uniref:hypothetical protein n=1 Tax=Palleronia pelagia TaxID=387096 RepID=UPI0011140B66|nr:hypothetical protein [Palleronia pelagia]